MKKVISILSALMVLLALTACAGKATKPTYVGNWELDHAVIDGTAYTRAELKAIGQDANMKLLLKENGKAFLTVDTDSEVLNWSETKNGIRVGGATLTIEDGLLCGESDDYILYFKKVPESRLNEEQADKATQEAETKSPETTAPATEATTEPTVEATTEPTTAPTTEATTEPMTEATTVPPTEATAELIDGMRPDFKEAMDAYEAFYKEYCELLKKYTANPTDFSILGQYANMLTKADEVDKAFKKWDESDLNSEELKYYLDVNNRVLKMMVDVTG